MEEQNLQQLQSQQQPTPQPEEPKRKLLQIVVIVVIILLIIIGGVLYYIYPQIKIVNLENKYGSSILKIEGVFDLQDVYWDFRENGIIYYTNADGIFGRMNIQSVSQSVQAELNLSIVREMLTALVSEDTNYTGGCSGTNNTGAFMNIPIAYAQVNTEGLRTCSNSRYYFDVTFEGCSFSAYRQYCAYMPRSVEEGKDNFLEYVDNFLSAKSLPTVTSVYNQYYTEVTGNNF